MGAVDEAHVSARRVIVVLGLVGMSLLLALIPPVVGAWAIFDSAGLDRLYRAESSAAGPLVQSLQAVGAGAAGFAVLWFRTGAGR